ncbi:EamA family transporter [Demequina zhanjiangensis]|uniref:EamA family transporter n=1 Tax=Demequina zhanjiangensis TaxID=3051659 RepID=A0ABT8G1E1_9MICO|nr:EamA family transporter [Demequina sp. SYSU T00b26]MDN4472779.1 EamA family transporter [Demequina sp. SYSU T00b26]
MPRRHVALALLTAVLWGVNFLAIHASLAQFPPFLLVALRFAVIAVPTVLLVPRPQVPWRWLLLYGLGFGTLQFLFLYLGMSLGFPTGLSSLVLQASAPFTVVLGAVLLRERIGVHAGLGVAVAATGLALVGLSYGADAAVAPFLLVLLGALGWAFGNLASRQARAERPLHLVLWMSIVPPLPMLAMSLVFEGPARISDALATSFTTEALPAWAGLAYTVLLGTLLGSGIWVWLMARHPAGTVAPFSMLVPVVGILTAWLTLGERPGPGELLGGALVIGGVLWASRAGRMPRVGASPTSDVRRGRTPDREPALVTAEAES